MVAPQPDMGPAQAWQDLHRVASARYRRCGPFSWHFARGKLKRDPVFRALLAGAAIAPGTRLLDIGCGQALLASLLSACETLAAANRWPSPWGAPPSGVHYTGIEVMPTDVARAEAGSGGLAIAAALDLRRHAAHGVRAMRHGGRARRAALRRRRGTGRRAGPHHAGTAARWPLVARVGDPAQSARFWISRWVDHAVTLARGHRDHPRRGVRSPAGSRRCSAAGSQVRTMPMSQGTPFANVLLVCDLERGR